MHYNQHGLVLLEGRGIYRLGKDWYLHVTLLSATVIKFPSDFPVAA